MSKRLHVLFGDDEFVELRETALRHHMTISEWVRQTLRDARRQDPRRAAQAKLEVVRRAARHGFSSASIDQMLDEIERGHTVDTPE